MIINSIDKKLTDELILIAKLFYTTEEYNSVSDNIYLLYDINITENNIIMNVKIQYNEEEYTKQYEIISNNNKYIKRYTKIFLYEIMSNKLNEKLPWGALTGIRPTKVLYDLMSENNGNLITAKKILINQFYVSKEKADIVENIILNQKKYFQKNDKHIDLYVNIPFCPSKCYYCSFISEPLKSCENLLSPYLEKLIYEIESVKKIINEYNYIVKSIYIGGGTPTVLNEIQLDELLSHLTFSVDEFTVECGRPDTITKEKLDVLKKHNVTRISINPQTFCDTTLKKIGRNHTKRDVFNAYKLALPYGFQINMDLIAGLKDESLLTFKRSVDTAVELYPDNLTIHTLCVKRASSLKDSNDDIKDESVLNKMINYSNESLTKVGYKPYYLYRQKYMIGNLENIGYTLNTPCTFNIDSMEEICSIIAVGANAISKRYFSDSNRIERFANVKNINEYINRIDEMIENKRKLFK